MLELKETIDENIKKAIIAFANCKGGTVYAGVKDDGTIAGLKDIDDSMLRLSNMIRDSIRPDITMFVNYKIIQEQGRQ
ncbi:ATP-binding protein [Treponema sp. OMZ 790]|uniref:AlbA family DNA-binding domain-containing protein n=1 Tax=Treponema sp. OMZ 790 TaxID=2563665 RepID=UPI002111510B